MMGEWQPIGTEPTNRRWWIIWDDHYKQPYVSTCRNNEGQFFEGDWDYQIQASHWLDIEEPSNG